MSLLFDDLYYIMNSEAVKRHYADLLIVIRLDTRRLPTLKDIVLERKYLSLGDVLRCLAVVTLGFENLVWVAL